VTGDKKKSGIIRKYGLNMSRQVFREKAQDIGFVKVCCPPLRAERGKVRGCMRRRERSGMRADDVQYR
jgi:hypothetical protein